MSDQYYVRRAGKISGPAKAKLLEQYAANGKLQVTDEVATSPNGPWHAVGKVPLLARHLPAPDPLTDPFSDPLAAASLMADGVASSSIAPTTQAKVNAAKPTKKQATRMVRRILGPIVLTGLVVVAAFLFLKRDPGAALKEIGATVRRNKQDEIVVVTVSGNKNKQAFGKMTDAGMAHLKNLDMLERLHINYLPVTDTGLAYIRDLDNLQILKLVQTNVTDEGLLYLHGLTKLKEVNLLGTKVTVAGVRKLREALPNCKIIAGAAGASPDALESAAALTSVGAKIKWEVQDDDDSGPQQRVSIDLTEVTVGEINDDDFRHVAKLPNVRALALGFYQITHEGLVHIAKLTELEWLSLNGNVITTKGIVHLKGLKKLKELHLEGTGIGPFSLAELEEALPKCKIHK